MPVEGPPVLLAVISVIAAAFRNERRECQFRKFMRSRLREITAGLNNAMHSIFTISALPQLSEILCGEFWHAIELAYLQGAEETGGRAAGSPVKSVFLPAINVEKSRGADGDAANGSEMHEALH